MTTRYIARSYGCGQLSMVNTLHEAEEIAERGSLEGRFTNDGDEVFEPWEVRVVPNDEDEGVLVSTWDQGERTGAAEPIKGTVRSLDDYACRGTSWPA